VLAGKRRKGKTTHRERNRNPRRSWPEQKTKQTKLAEEALAREALAQDKEAVEREAAEVGIGGESGRSVVRLSSCSIFRGPLPQTPKSEANQNQHNHIRPLN
jgi:hypothetical protein